MPPWRPLEPLVLGMSPAAMVPQRLNQGAAAPAALTVPRVLEPEHENAVPENPPCSHPCWPARSKVGGGAPENLGSAPFILSSLNVKESGNVMSSFQRKAPAEVGSTVPVLGGVLTCSDAVRSHLA